MKYLVVVFILMLFVINRLSAQEIGSNYFFKSYIGSELSNEKLKIDKNKPIPEGAEIESNDQIKVVSIADGRVYFSYLSFDEGSEEEAIYNLDSNGKMKIFSLSVSDFKKLTNKYYNKFRGFKYGAYTVPIRLRKSSGKFEFDSNLSLGANLLGRFGSRSNENLFVDLSLGISLTKVSLHKENSLLGIDNSDFSEIDVLSPTAFTVSVGAFFNLAENVNVGAYLGWDSLSSADNKSEWVFNRKPWLGIGLNVAFSGSANDSSGSSSNSK